MGAIHRDRRYVTQSKWLRQHANSVPTAVCWRCSRTLNQHPAGAKWQAGHTQDGSTTWSLWPHVDAPPPLPGDWLAIEASSCNASAGARYGNRTRSTGYTWP